MREEKQFQKQEQIFTTYQRKPRKYQQARSKSALEEDDGIQQKQYEYIQALESQEEDLAGEIGQDIQETDEVIRQTKRINLFLDQQEKEKEKKSRQEMLKDSASLFSEQQTVEEEKKEDSVQKDEELGMDTNSVHLPMKMKKKKTSKKEIKRLKLEIKELEQRNEKLREVNWKLKVQRTRISKHAYRWYKQKKVYKAKYERLKVLYASRASTDASSQTGDQKQDGQQHSFGFWF